jgi:hypothetical protein
MAQPGRQDVRYLLQSQQPSWPAYSGASVHAPGVPTIVEDDSHWYLIFAGYPAKQDGSGPGATHFDSAHRKPFLASLVVGRSGSITVGPPAS